MFYSEFNPSTTETGAEYTVDSYLLLIPYVPTLSNTVYYTGEINSLFTFNSRLRSSKEQICKRYCLNSIRIPMDTQKVLDTLKTTFSTS